MGQVWLEKCWMAGFPFVEYSIYLLGCINTRCAVYNKDYINVLGLHLFGFGSPLCHCPYNRTPSSIFEQDW